MRHIAQIAALYILNELQWEFAIFFYQGSWIRLDESNSNYLRERQMTTKGREKDNRFIMLIRGLSVHFVTPFFVI